MYMQTVLNTWFWKSYLQTASVCGTIHRQSIHSCLLYCCISTLGDINSFGSIANIKTETKHLKGNPIKFVPQNNVSTRTAKVFKQGHSLIQMPNYSYTLWKNR